MKKQNLNFKVTRDFFIEIKYYSIQNNFKNKGFGNKGFRTYVDSKALTLKP